MKKEFKIVTIGGGSSYTPEFVEGLILRSSTLSVKELWLVDVEEGKHKLEIVGKLAQRMFEKAGLNTKVHLTLNRQEALKDADFVTTQFRVGLLDARVKDERIPLSHGYLGQETNGAGGLFKALRTIPVILDICADIKKLCPNAWLINFTNPAGMVTQAAIEYGKHDKTIGLCNVPYGMQDTIAQMYKVKYEDVKMHTAGLNHFFWGIKAYIDGRDVVNEVIENFIKNPAAAPANFAEQKWDATLLRTMGAIPCPYLRYYFTAEDMFKHMKEEAAEKGTRAEVVKKVEEKLFEIYKDVNLNTKPEELKDRGGAHYSDVACGVINAIANDTDDWVVANTRNNNTIRCLSEYVAIETTCVINKSGAHPIAGLEIPKWMENWFKLVQSYQDLTIEAAVKGDYNSLLLAFYINPLTPTGDNAKALIKDMMIAHEKYLPQFKSHIASYK